MQALCMLYSLRGAGQSVVQHLNVERQRRTACQNAGVNLAAVFLRNPDTAMVDHLLDSTDWASRLGPQNLQALRGLEIELQSVRHDLRAHVLYNLASRRSARRAASPSTGDFVKDSNMILRKFACNSIRPTALAGALTIGCSFNIAVVDRPLTL